MNVTLRQLRAFCALAQTASFTEAAVILFVTQSALSGLIRELEAALGVQLVRRSTRKVSLSDAGREFYPLAQKILQDLDGALGAIADIKALKRGVVRIAAPQLFSCSVLPDVMAGFAQEHPEIEVRLVDCMVEAVQTKVRSGEVDFGVGPERESSSDVDATPLFQMPFVVVFPRGNVLQKRKTVSWAEALSHPMIALQGEFTQRLRGDLQTGVRVVNFGPVREVGFMTTAFAMVSAGLGVTTCLPYANALISLHGLLSRPLCRPQVERKFFVFTRKDRVLSPAARCFEAYLLAFVIRQKW
jgi:DNA-binding transcriptional LysR family regulator